MKRPELASYVVAVVGLVGVVVLAALGQDVPDALSLAVTTALGAGAGATLPRPAEPAPEPDPYGDELRG